jgi:uncharacterized membrane protein
LLQLLTLLNLLLLQLMMLLLLLWLLLLLLLVWQSKQPTQKNKHKVKRNIIQKWNSPNKKIIPSLL